jgi:hypothetical protein
MRRNYIHIHRLLLIILFTGLLPMKAMSQEPQVSVSSQVDKARITIGDLIEYSITVVHDKDVQVEMPGLGANLGGFDIRDYDVAEPEKRDGMIVSGVQYMISTFFTGEFEIPPLTVAYYTTGDSTAKHLSTEKIKIVVESLKPSEAGDIRDIKTPVELPRNLWLLIRWFVLGAGVILLALAGYMIYRKKKRGEGLFPAKPEIKRPPHEIALEALDRLKLSDLLQKGEIKQFYIEISEIIRQYIGGRYFIVAMEMTTTDVLAGFAEADVSDEEFELFQHFFFECDLVKFARVIPSGEETEEIVNTAYEIINRTTVVFEKEEAGETASASVEDPHRDTIGEDEQQLESETISAEVPEKELESKSRGESE